MDYEGTQVRNGIRAMEDNIFRALMEADIAVGIYKGHGPTSVRKMTIGEQSLDYLEIVGSGKGVRVSVGASRSSRKSWYTHFGPTSKKRAVVETEVVEYIAKLAVAQEQQARRNAEAQRGAKLRAAQVSQITAKHKLANVSNVRIEEEYYSTNGKLTLSFKNMTAQQIDSIVAYAKTLGIK
jgi:hypothetical protein